MFGDRSMSPKSKSRKSKSPMPKFRKSQSPTQKSPGQNLFSENVLNWINHQVI